MLLCARPDVACRYWAGLRKSARRLIRLLTRVDSRAPYFANPEAKTATAAQLLYQKWVLKRGFRSAFVFSAPEHSTGWLR